MEFFSRMRWCSLQREMAILASTGPGPLRPPPMPNLLPKCTIRTPGRAILHDAAKCGDLAQLEAALDVLPATASVDNVQFGFSAIHLASKGGHLAAMAMLIDRGADVNARAGNDATPLHCAAEMDKPEALALLLSRGADLHAVANVDDTVLHYAALNGRLAATKLLVAKGADVHAKNTIGLTPWEDAKQADKGRCACQDPSAREWTMVGAFLAHVMPLSAEARVAFAQRANERPAAAVLHDAAELGNAVDLVRILEGGRCDLDAKDYDGSAAIHAAAEGGHANAVSLLLDWKCDVHAENNYKDTALHLAARAGLVPIVRLLVAKGANVHARNRFGSTPLELCTRQQRGEWEAVAEFLTEEALEMDELPPAARAMRKIRAAFHSQLKPPLHSRAVQSAVGGSTGLLPPAPPPLPPSALADVSARPVGGRARLGSAAKPAARAPLRYRGPLPPSTEQPQPMRTVQYKCTEPAAQ